MNGDAIVGSVLQIIPLLELMMINPIHIDVVCCESCGQKSEQKIKSFTFVKNNGFGTHVMICQNCHVQMKYYQTEKFWCIKQYLSSLISDIAQIIHANVYTHYET